ncbi:hypothetical protein [Saccharibacillus kuerlensis]|uniref:Uncharacterized protein n=1 Tax=Saccharibacillus kuerlensis TaxID=459527 RepID=A0ABQ2L478_9BACL|nr:hypothetical protein [Saccharibacillus kuerlensis]GGO01790.1 hypothetical protein GCM10010969_24480 [Saccharibacillus kuerlensis]
MPLYRELLALDTVLDQLQERSIKLHTDYRKEPYDEFKQWAGQQFRRGQLMLILSCMQLGTTGRRNQWTYVPPDESKRLMFPMPILQSSEEMLQLHFRYMKYWDRELMLDWLARNNDLSIELRSGLDLLSENVEKDLDIYYPSYKSSTWISEDLPLCPQDLTILVVRISGNHDHYDFALREDAALQIERLQEQFYTWIYSQEGVHPFRRFDEHMTEGRITFSDWVYTYNPHSFMDWLNIDVYESLVGWVIEESGDRPYIKKIYF